jgi:hypothetical protein
MNDDNESIENQVNDSQSQLSPQKSNFGELQKNTFDHEFLLYNNENNGCKSKFIEYYFDQALIKKIAIILALVVFIYIFVKFAIFLCVGVFFVALSMHLYSSVVGSNRIWIFALKFYLVSAIILAVGLLAESMAENLLHKQYIAADFSKQLKMCLRPVAVQGLLSERLADGIFTAKSRMDWEISMGQDRLIAGELYAQNLKAMVENQGDKNRLSGEKTLKNCTFAKNSIDSVIPKIDSISDIYLLNCYNVATNGIIIGKMSTAKSLEQYPRDTVSWPEMKSGYELCVNHLKFNTKSLIAEYGEF